MASAPTSKLSWHRPPAVAKRVAAAAQRDMRRLMKIGWAAGALVGIPAVVAVHLLDPSETPMTAAAVALVMAVWPTLFMLEPWIQRKWPARFHLDESGFVGNGIWGKWKWVEGAEVRDHPDVEGMRVVELRTSGRRFPVKLEYDPEVVDEDEVIRVLNERIHARVLLRPSSAAEGDAETLLRPTTGMHSEEPETLLRAAEKE